MLSNDDIQHFMQPYLPFDNIINISSSTDVCVKDTLHDHFGRINSTPFYICQSYATTETTNNFNSKHSYCTINIGMCIKYIYIYIYSLNLTNYYLSK